MRIAASLTAVALTVAPSANAQLPSVPQAVANVQAFYNGVSTYNANFTQRYLIRALNTTVTSTGNVTFAKPGKMNWFYLQPPGNRVVVNGQNVWVHQASTNQNVSTQAQVPAALSFLTGQGQFASSFTFTMPSTLSFPGGYVLAGTPITPTPQFNTALFYVDGQTSQIRRVMLIDGQGNRNQFDFDSVTININVPPQTFVP